MIWAKNNKKQHNVFKDRSTHFQVLLFIIDEVPFKINRNQDEFTLMRSSKIDLNRNVSQTNNNSYDSGSFNGFPGLKPGTDHRKEKSMHNTSALIND
jgi:hypothetical protein